MNYDIPAQQFRVPWDNAEGMIKQGREVTVMFSLVNQVNVRYAPKHMSLHHLTSHVYE